MFKVLEHIHKSCFEVFGLCLSCVTLFRAYCSSVAGFLEALTSCVFVLVFELIVILGVGIWSLLGEGTMS